jgi:hypothetical protein
MTGYDEGMEKINESFLDSQPEVSKEERKKIEELMDNLSNEKPLLIKQAEIFLRIKEKTMETFDERIFNLLFASNDTRKIAFKTIEKSNPQLLNTESLTTVENWMKKKSSEISESINKISLKS